MTENSDLTKDDKDSTIVIPPNTKEGFVFNTNSPPTYANSSSFNQGSSNKTRFSPNISYLAYGELQVGSVIKETFEVVAVLGQGGMGTVYKALNKVWAEVEARDPYVAIKVLKPELSENKQLVRSLYSDFDRTKMLANCPNVIKVHGFDRDGPLVFMTMEYISGQTLTDYLKNKPMNLAKAWFIIEGIGNALAYAHENNIVHRDIKPGNIIITDDGDVKVLDFGIASKINEHEGDETKFGGHELGALTVAYASPEMQKDYPPDIRDDIYEFACVIYEILTGTQFYKQKTLKAPPIKGLNSRQMEVLNKSLAFERDQRTASVRELLDKLRPVKHTWVKSLGLLSGVVIIVGLGLWWKLPIDVNRLLDNALQQAITEKQSPGEAFSEKDSDFPKPQTLVTETGSDELTTEEAALKIPGQESLDVRREVDHISTSSDSVVQIQTSKPEYKNGEAFHLSFRLAKPMYVRIIDRDAKGEVTTLRPNTRQPDKLLSANEEHVFPPNGFNVRVKGPSGNCTVTIIASVKPFSEQTKLLNDDGSLSQQVQKSDLYSWMQVRYVLRR